MPEKAQEIREGIRIITIDRERMKKDLGVIDSRPAEQRGMQPALVLDCFLRHDFRDNSFCVERCDKYWKCRNYLEGYKI
jgi:hypothetical protein